jgi:hypothetical protein
VVRSSAVFVLEKSDTQARHQRQVAGENTHLAEDTGSGDLLDGRVDLRPVGCDHLKVH